mgnify:CR=1 FL=1
MTVRQRKEILETLYKDFKDYKLPAEITMQGYLTITDRGLMRKFIKRTFKTWPRTIKAMQQTYPDVFDEKKTSPPKPETPAPVVDPLAALGTASLPDVTETDNG